MTKIVLLALCLPAGVAFASVVQEVNCFLGTEGTGHTFPAAAYPFGLVQAGPDTGWGTWEYCSGYQYRDTRITMFSQTHNSGGGCSDYADIGIMPVTGDVSVPVQIPATEKGRASTTSVAREYDKASERAEPGYYTVTLADGIRVEVAASEFCAVYRITYPQGVTPRLLVDLDYGMEGNPAIGYGERKRTMTKESAWREGELLAHVVKNGFVPDRQIGVAMRFEPKPASVAELPRQPGDHAPQYVADFDLANDRTLLVRIGLSTMSAAGAMRNLERQVGSVGFDDVCRAASEKWEEMLSRIRLEGGDHETRINFATAVYRMFLQPQNIADADAPEPRYSEFSLWDTFRGAHPIYTLAAKEYVPKFVNSMIDHQERFGYLPVLPKWGRDTQCMIGTHAVSVIAEAYFKGFKDVDWERAFRAVKDTLTRPHKDRTKENWDLYDRYGYYPFDEIRGESVSRTLECSYDDWCAMRLAEALGHGEEAAFFRRRANCWTNVFDRSIGFVRGKDTLGRWRTPFDPYQLGHGATTANDFTEGNAFQYTWHVLQDPVGLMEAMGGRQAFVRKLDELFAAKNSVEGAGFVLDVTGLIGQYAHGNEPSHHIAYLYQYAGRGDCTAEKVREICRKFYRNAPDGLCGNEDHGEMSAWYVFACMGFYPVSPASGEYVLGAPQVPSVCVDVGGGKVFRVVAKGLSEQAKYVRAVSLNGRPLEGFILRHADIENGGELVFEMTDRPSPAGRAVCADNCRYVDVFVGTSATGHTTPAAARPLGMVQAGPDTGTGSWDYCSGYRYEDKRICGFSQTHLSGTGGLDLGDIRILPFVGESVPDSVAFEKKDESAEPGRYSVAFENGTKVEIAAGHRSAIYRIRFGSGRKRLLVDTQWGIVGGCKEGLAVERHVVSSTMRADGRWGVIGTNRTSYWSERSVSCALSFGVEASAVVELPRKPTERAPKYVFDFDLPDGAPLILKVALSANSEAAARRNLEAEIPGWDFDAVAKDAHDEWRRVLETAECEGDEAAKRSWYTALYHLYFQPNDISDVGEKPFYSTLSTWDTFRAAHPLYTILTPEIIPGFVDSMLEQGRRTGYLPIWTLWGHDNQCMIGTHSVPIIVDWFMKEHMKAEGEQRNFNLDYWQSAYMQIKETLTKKHDGRSKENWDVYDKYGYYPFDLIRGESVSRTMECAYDDWCAGKMAERLGHAEDAVFFFKRASSWKNVFDPSLGLVRGKDTKGNWRKPFNPFALGHGADIANDFTEGNAFQYSWHVMQDVDGLVAAMGGRGPFVKRLDSLFEAPSNTEGMGELVDVTGLIGQYVHGNEPSHHVIYFYPQVGHPEKAAERIREVFDKFYLAKPDGLCGNDDCGQMSAWCLFSAMGFYPFNPSGGEYVIGAPQLEKVVVKVGGQGQQRTFTVLAKGLSKANKYVKSVTLNGKPITDWKIRHEDIIRGGRLEFEMTAGLPVR